MSFFLLRESFFSIDQTNNIHRSIAPCLPLCLFLSVVLAMQTFNTNVQSKRVSVLGSPLTHSSTGADEEEAAAIIFVVVDDLEVAER